MADKNKVVFGLSNVYFGKYNVATDGTVTLGDPVKVPGAVNMSLEPQSEENVFWADNVKYYTSFSDNGFEGELEMARFPDTFKTTFLNYVALADDGIGQVKGMETDPVYIMFEIDGDKQKRRGILYNASLGAIIREYATTEDTKEPQTATLAFTVNGDAKTGLTRASYDEEAAGYATLFENPPAPALPASA